MTLSFSQEKKNKREKQQPGQYLALSLQLYLLDEALLGSGVTGCCDGFWRRHLRDSREATRHRVTPSESGAKRWQRFTNQDGPSSLAGSSERLLFSLLRRQTPPPSSMFWLLLVQCCPRAAFRFHPGEILCGKKL